MIVRFAGDPAAGLADVVIVDGQWPDDLFAALPGLSLAMAVAAPGVVIWWVRDGTAAVHRHDGPVTEAAAALFRRWLALQLGQSRGDGTDPV